MENEYQMKRRLHSTLLMTSSSALKDPSEYYYKQLPYGISKINFVDGNVDGPFVVHVQVVRVCP
jgi:hypothetical protein